MEMIKTDIVIVGGGMSGLATALALHRLGIKSMVLESSDILRAAGYAITTWTNAWRALDALGIANSLRQHNFQIFGISSFSSVTGDLTSHGSFRKEGAHGDHEVRCVKRKDLLEALEKELPSGTIRYSSRVVSIEESGFSKLVHLADGSVLETKVLLGCEGINSVVAKWLGFRKPVLLERSAIRGCTYYEDGHGYEPEFQMSIGNGCRIGMFPIDDKNIYWFLSWSPSAEERRTLQEADQLKLKQTVLSKLGKTPHHFRVFIEDAKVEDIVRSPLGYRPPLQVLFGQISKDNVSVAGDACHPMAPDLGLGGCLAVEDGVILAKCLADALLKNSNCQNEGDQFKRITRGLKNYAEKTRWRAFDLICKGYMSGLIQESKWLGMRYLREINFISAYLSEMPLKAADVSPGQFLLE